MGIPREVSDLVELSSAERQVLAELDTGEDIVLGDGEVPETGDESRKVRARLIRILLLGSDPKHQPHEKGVRILGAWIPDALDLEGCRIPRDIALISCRFDATPVLRSACIDGLFLNGGVVPGLSADRLEATGGVFLRDGFEATGAVRLLGAKLGGNLDCVGATFRAKKDAAGKSGHALFADGAMVEGAFYLRGDARVFGLASLAGAEVRSLVDDPACWPGRGDLILDRFRYGAIVGGPVDADTRIEWLGRQESARWGVDFWPQPYEQCAKVLREMGHGEDARKVLIAKERLQRAAQRDGLDAQLTGARLRMRIERSQAQSAWPDVVAAVNSLRASDPRRALMMRELRKSPQVRALLAGDESSASDVPEGTSDRIMAARAPIWDYRWRLSRARVWDGLVGATIGYGRAPQRAALWALGFLLFGWFVFAVAGGHGAIKPNNAFMLRQAAWTDCAPEEGRARLGCFEAEASSYPSFNAFIYSADTLLPIVSLEMQKYWIPDDDTGRGAWARGYLWVHIAVGWALSLLAVAGFSGLVKSD